MKRDRWSSIADWLGCVRLSKEFTAELKALIAQECGLQVKDFDEVKIRITGSNLEFYGSKEQANLLIDNCFDVARVAVKLNCESILAYWPGCEEPDEIGAELANEVDDRV